ncbi:Uncharacterised protein [Vibrio cholerae]|nr:Uncharacterised protein [Vibrio cholerae]CSI32356.1 Uncharacterised protein [Vibrio cholerae]
MCSQSHPTQVVKKQHLRISLGEASGAIVQVLRVLSRYGVDDLGCSGSGGV